MNEFIADKISLSASVSCFNLYNIESDMDQINASRVRLLHFDVVDGRFNNCFILGTPTLNAIRPHTRLPIEVHLGVYEPMKFIEQYAKAGADYIAIHYEAENKPGLLKCFEAIRQNGAAPVLALRAETTVNEEITELLPFVPWVLKLNVDPGYAGQKIKPSAYEEIKKLRQAIREKGLKTGIQADGNVNPETIPLLVQSGADILTGGTSGLFLKDRPIAQSAEALIKLAERYI